MMLRRFAVLALVSTAAALAACRDTTGTSAVNPVGADTLVAYSITGPNPSLPSALNTATRSVVRISGAANFDIGFNLKSDGSVDLIPVRQLVSSVFGSPQVAIMLVTTPFDSLSSAPNGYYRPDTTTNVKTGQTFVILSNQTSTTGICYYFASPHLYSKGVVDNVDMTTGAIHFRDVVDQNCGYRSFLPGFPAN